MGKINKVLLISPLDSFRSYGLRLVSSYLKENQIETKMIFLPAYTEMWQQFFTQEVSQFDNKILNKINDIASDCDLIGITMMTMDRNKVKLLCQSLKKLNKKIIIGGIHPTIFPEDAIQLADMVNIGEGFESIVELCKTPESKSIDNIWFKDSDQIIKNNIRPAIENIDKLPFPDFDHDNHYVLIKNNIVKVDREIQEKLLGIVYHQFATLGCPFSCTYCINDTYKKIGLNYNRFRFHSIDYIINEIKYGLSIFPKVEYINFPDDGFIAMNEDIIAEFTEKYKKEINLPFSIMGLIPNFVTKKKIDLLYNAGLKRVRMGIQSFDQETLQLYKRPQSTLKISEINDIFQSYDKLVFPYYDIILDNPFIPNEKAILETIHSLLKLKGKFTLFLFSLRFYPGTEIFKMAIQNKLPKRGFSDSYLDYDQHFLNYILTIIQSTGSKNLTKLLLKFYYRFGNFKVPKFLFYINKSLFMVRCGIEHIRKGDISGLPNFICRFLHMKK